MNKQDAVSRAIGALSDRAAETEHGSFGTAALDSEAIGVLSGLTVDPPGGLYFVTDGTPGPNTASPDERRKLIGEIRRTATAVEQDVFVREDLVLLLRRAAIEIERVGAQFVELETADGDGVGPLGAGASWEPHPHTDKHGWRTEAGEPILWRLGPLYPASTTADAAVGTVAEELRALREYFEKGAVEIVYGGSNAP